MSHKMHAMMRELSAAMDLLPASVSRDRKPAPEAANDQGGDSLSAFAALDNVVDHEDLQRGIEDMSPASLAFVRDVEVGPLAAWRTWRRIALTDGGWIRIVPVDPGAQLFVLHVAGTWADQVKLAGMHLVKAGDVVMVIENFLDKIEGRRAKQIGGDLGRALRLMGLDKTTWAGRLHLVDRHRPTVSVEVARNMCVDIMRGVNGDKLAVRTWVGPQLWQADDLKPQEVPNLLVALKTSAESRIWLDQMIQARADRREKLLQSILPGDPALVRIHQVLWVSPVTVDLALAGQLERLISMPSMELPEMWRRRFSHVALDIHGLVAAPPTRALPAGGAPAEYSVALAGRGSPWVARVSLATIADALKG